jgi:ribosomal-protein-alanine N-acetyltransferase
MATDVLPHLETSSLVLRPFTPRDARKVFELSQEDGMKKWVPSQVYGDEAHAASVLAFLAAQYRPDIELKTSPYVLGIELKTTGELVGHVGLSPLHGEVEIGFAVEQSQQRKGIATEAVHALCEWAAVKSPKTRILGITARENPASQRVLVRAGFQHQAETEMLFQGLEQPVLVFAYSSQRYADEGKPNLSLNRACLRQAG